MSRFDVAGVRARILNQYFDSPKMLELLGALADDPRARARSALESLYGRLDIEKSVGIQLDRIGEILGQPRPDSFELALTDVDSGFAFAGSGPNDFAKGFSGLSGARSGGQFVGIAEGQAMSDPDYRLILKAAIYRNNNGATITDLETYSQMILGVPAVVSAGVGFVDIRLPRRIGTSERELIFQTMTPAAGVRVRTYTFIVAEDGFGFAGGAGNTGFGGLGELRVGSGFAGIF